MFAIYRYLKTYGEKMCQHYIGAKSSNRKQKQLKNINSV